PSPRLLSRASPSFFFQSSAPHPALPSFPTRRSSDLDRTRRRPARGVEGYSDDGTWNVPMNPLRPTRTSQRSPRPSPWKLFSNARSEEHTSELQSLTNLVCRLLLEKKKKPHICAQPLH